jgi:hypothetical protein
VSTDVSEEHIASIFRVEEISSARNQQASRWQRTTRRYIPEVDTIHNHRCQNLKSYTQEQCLYRQSMEKKLSGSDWNL